MLGMPNLIAGFLLFSGFAGLIYQVAWVRLIGQSLGATSVSVAIVISSFFLGLALGSHLAGRMTWLRSRIATYALLEICIGLSALVLLPILLNLDSILAMAPAFGSSLVLKAALCLALLILPTTAMGATFPVAAALLEDRSGHTGRQISRLYSLNTLGAVLGAALSGLWIIPALGLDGAVYLAAAINLAIAALAFALSRSGDGDRGRATLPAEDTATRPAYRTPALITLALTGVVSIASQVGWTKFLVIYIGSTISGLSIILAVFLSGIAMGAWLMGRRIATLKSPATAMATLLAALPFALIASRFLLSLLPDIQAIMNRAGEDTGLLMFIRAATIAAALLPPTVLLGAIFPLNVQLCTGAGASTRRDIGTAYAINTLFSIAGAATGGLLIIPLWGTDILLVTMAGLAAVAAVTWMPWLPRLSSRMALLVPVLASIALLAAAKGIDYRSMIANAGYDDRSRAGKVPTFHFLKEGKAGVISLTSYDGKQMLLQNNGLNEAGFTPGDPGDVPVIEVLLGLVPYILHTDPQSALVIGLGAGNTAAVLADTDVARIRIVELEPAVTAAIRAVAGSPVKVLDDARVEITYNDARNTLAVDDESYDLIVSQPSHPWVAGTAGVFTREFWEIASRRLNDGGLFAQWLNLFRMNETTLRAVLKSFFEVFPEGFVLSSERSLILVGSNGAIILDELRAREVLARPAMSARLGPHGVKDANDLLWYYVLARDEALALAGDSPGNLDRNILSEVELARLTRDPKGAEDPEAILRAASRMDPTHLLEDNTPQRLAQFADYLIAQDGFDKAHAAIRQLRAGDPDAAHSLELRLLLARGDYPAAFKLYYSDAGWSDAARLALARAFADVGRMDQAWEAAAGAADSPARTAELARLSYLDPERAMAGLQGPVAAAWQMLARHRAAPAEPAVTARELEAAEGLLSVTDSYFAKQALLSQALLRQDDRDIARHSRALAEAARRNAARLVIVGQHADAAGDIPLLGEVLVQIYKLDELVDGYEALRSRYAKLVPAAATGEGQ
jgi:spermidine synthase